MNKTSVIAFVALGGILMAKEAKQDGPPKPAKPSPGAEVSHQGAWPVFRGDSALNGVASEVLVPPLELAWRSEMTGPIVATAAIAKGTVFIGSQDGDFRALHLSTGKEKWKRQLGFSIESSACVIGGVVYVGSGDGFLYALRAETGEEVWKYKTEGEILGGVNFLEKDGQTYLYVGSYDNSLHCVDAATGKRKWTVPTGSMVNGTPAVADGMVMFGGCDAVLYLVDAITGEDRGSIEIGSYIANSVSVKDGVVYMAHYGNQAEAYSIAKKKRVWIHSERDFPYFASPAVFEDLVLVADQAKRLYALNRRDGEVKWTFRARRRIDSSPVISGRMAYMGSDDGRIYAVRLDSGKEAWSYEVGDAITAAPAIAGGRLVIGGQDGFVYALRPVE